MGKVNVVVVDATGNKEQKVGLPDDIKCGIIMVKLVEKIKLPSVGPDGNPISYKFVHKVTGRQLLETQTLSEAGIKDGDVLRLQPEITAGAVCSNCGNVELDGSQYCSKCGSQITAPHAFAPNSQENAGYTANNTPQVFNQAAEFFSKAGSDKSKTVLILGIVAAALYGIAWIVISFALMSYTDDLYRFMLFLQHSGETVFMIMIALFLYWKIKENKT